MAEIKVDKLKLSLAGLSEKDGKELAQRIADGLADAKVPDSAPGSESMLSSLTYRPGSSMPELAGRVVADLVRELNRSI